ncbi:MAG: purine-nucleoside phosphorylase [Eubacteriaceae bacterium]|nr:purine-nucleoside phosphorylase [Eubacteriaceae bacterium]
MATVHNRAGAGEIAKTVLMPGDPLRAKHIAESYLGSAKLVNDVRGMLAYTGTYKGSEITVMGSGMGMPSIGIYSYELFTEYGVESIIRVGSCGAYSDKVHVRDIILAQGACTDSNYADQYGLNGTFAPLADFGLLYKAKQAADKLGIPVAVGNTLSTDVFYSYDSEGWKKWAAMGVLAVEMEAAALYMNAASLQKKALAILTVSDHFVYEEMTTSQEREKTFNDMIELALEFAGTAEL